MAAPPPNYQIVIEPKKHLLDFNLREIWQYRDLILLFVHRDFVTYYKQTILGPLWFLIQPLLTTVIFMVIFGRIAQIPTDGLPQPLFYMSGIVLWNYFAEGLKKTSNTFVGNQAVFGKVYFPRLAVPVSIVISNLFTFIIQLAIFVVFVIYFLINGVELNIQWYIALFPLLVIQAAFLGLGFGIIISSLTTKYKDLTFLVGFGVQLWMYITPIAYPLSEVPEKWAVYFHLNPMSAIVENFRFMVLGTGSVSITNTLISVAFTIIVLLGGILLFNRIEKNFMDVV